MPETRITLAAVAGAHGIGGEVRLKLFAESVDSLKRYKAVRIGERDVDVLGIRPGNQGAIARLAGVSSRDEAEALRGQLVTIDRSQLPALAADEFYHADLIGLDCRDCDGAVIGTVVGVENYGAGDLLEVQRSDGGRTLVPFRAPAAVLEASHVRLDPLFLA